MTLSLYCQTDSQTTIGFNYEPASLSRTAYDTVEINGKTVYYKDDLGNGNKHQLLSNNIWTPIGLWRTWHKSGNIASETIYTENWYEIKYINQWKNDGTQNLISGNGFLTKVNNHVVTISGQDSIVYEIRDSLKNGFAYTWRSIENASYYLFQTGQYIKNREQPIRNTYYPNGKLQSISSVVNRAKEGEYIEFHQNGLHSEYGSYVNGKKTGAWKEWNDAGILINLSTYVAGKYRGPYKEFHGDGTIKTIGSYDFSNGIDTIHVYDPETYEETIIYEETQTFPCKHGKWEHYNKHGKLIREERYNKGKLTEN